MGKRSIFVSSFPLSLDVVALGRLVGFMKTPAQDFFDPATELPDKPKPDSTASQINDISRMLKASNGTGLELALTAFASAFLKGENKDARQLTAKEDKQYLLLRADDWFERILKSQTTQMWLERAAIRGRKAYLVTGIQTLRDVDITTSESWTFGAGVGAEAPLLTAAGVPIPSPLDPGAKVDYSIEREKTLKGSMPDEEIYAIQYREIRLRRILSSNASAPNLTHKIWWEQICSERGADDDKMDEDDDEIVEAELLDGIEGDPGLQTDRSASEDVIYWHE